MQTGNTDIGGPSRKCEQVPYDAIRCNLYTCYISFIGGDVIVNICRLIDGREAVTFLRKVKMAVQDPRTMLMNL